MEGTGAKQAQQKVVNPAGVNPAVVNAAVNPAVRAGAGPVGMEHRVVRCGLPCAKCRAYYASDLQACPICRSTERVSAKAVAPLPINAGAPPSDEAKLTEERERLRELKSQIYASHPIVPPAATFRCALDQNHNGTVEPAAVCHNCYGGVRQQADRMEAALHMDVKEAAKIVYDAVWADTSDPNKTYLNAANALLGELRKRSGIGLLVGANTPFAH